jgi:hypothetical protein
MLRRTMENEFLQLKELCANFENLKDEDKDRLLKIGENYLNGDEKPAGKNDGFKLAGEKLA